MNKQQIQSNKWYQKLLELLKEDYIHINQFSRTGAVLSSQSAMVWHYTADPGATDEREQDYFDDNLGRQNPNDNIEDRYAGAHIFIDKDSGRITIPLWEMAYHAGDTWYNHNSLSCELCIEKDGSFHPATIARAVKVGALLQLIFGWKTDRNIRHYDVTKKLCPKPWVDNPTLFTQFKRDVEAQIKVYLSESSTPVVDKSVDKPCNIEVNGKTLPAKGKNRNGVTRLPIRAVSEAVGVIPEWCPTTKQVRVNNHDLDETIEDGVSYAPTHQLADALHVTVDWDNNSKTVKLKGGK